MSTTEQKAARWYAVDIDGAATLCVDQADAEQVAKTAQAAWPHLGPHRAVQLVEAPLMGAAGDAAPVVAQETLAEIALIEKAVQRVGIKSLLNHGAGSLVYSEGVQGVTQSDLVAYTREIALHCAVALAADPSSAKGVAHADQA